MTDDGISNDQITEKDDKDKNDRKYVRERCIWNSMLQQNPKYGQLKSIWLRLKDDLGLKVSKIFPGNSQDWRKNAYQQFDKLLTQIELTKLMPLAEKMMDQLFNWYYDKTGAKVKQIDDVSVTDDEITRSTFLFRSKTPTTQIKKQINQKIRGNSYSNRVFTGSGYPNSSRPNVKWENSYIFYNPLTNLEKRMEQKYQLQRIWTQRERELNKVFRHNMGNWMKQKARETEHTFQRSEAHQITNQFTSPLRPMSQSNVSKKAKIIDFRCQKPSKKQIFITEENQQTQEPSLQLESCRQKYKSLIDSEYKGTSIPWAQEALTPYTTLHNSKWKYKEQTRPQTSGNSKVGEPLNQERLSQIEQLNTIKNRLSRKKVTCIGTTLETSLLTPQDLPDSSLLLLPLSGEQLLNQPCAPITTTLRKRGKFLRRKR